MAGIITSLPPFIEQPPGNNSSNPAGLPGVTYTFALLGLAQTWTAKQTFPQGEISLFASDIIGLTPSAVTNSTFQIITGTGDVTVTTTDVLIIMNRTVGAASNVNLPAAATKIRGVKIVDWKGDSGTNPITVKPNGSEKFNDGQTSWPIAGAGASVTFDPIPTGLGYAV